MQSILRWIPAFTLAILCVGCGGGGPSLTPVEGTVIFDGQPLSDAELTFVPDPNNEEVTVGSAITDAEGKYRARYLGRFGLAPGKYKVTFSKTAVDPNAGDIPPEMLDDPEQLALSGASIQTLPDTYSDIEKTAFDIEVIPGGSPYDFELDSEGR